MINFQSPKISDFIGYALSLLIAWNILLHFIEDTYIAPMSLFHFAITYEIGYKAFYKKNRKIAFFCFFLFPSIFILLFIVIRLILIWMEQNG